MHARALQRAAVTLVVLLLAACAGPSLQPPDGFPLMPGAAPLPAEGDAVGRWRSEEHGSAVYSWYLAALPAAGFSSLETAPGGSVAIIRFADRDATPWQLDLSALGGADDGTEIRLGRPRP